MLSQSRGKFINSQYEIVRFDEARIVASLYVSQDTGVTRISIRGRFTALFIQHGGVEKHLSHVIAAESWFSGLQFERHLPKHRALSTNSKHRNGLYFSQISDLVDDRSPLVCQLSIVIEGSYFTCDITRPSEVFSFTVRSTLPRTPSLGHSRLSSISTISSIWKADRLGERC